MKNLHVSQPMKIYDKTLDLTDPKYSGDIIDFHFMYHTTLLNVPVYICDDYLDFSADLLSYSRRDKHSVSPSKGVLSNITDNPPLRNGFGCDYFITINSELLDKPTEFNFVILHELGHFVLKHQAKSLQFSHNNFFIYMIKELEADIFALMMGADITFVVDASQTEAMNWYVDILKVFKSNYLGQIGVNDISIFTWYMFKSLRGMYRNKFAPRLYEHFSKLSIR